ncbi:MAG: stage V sporulation protein D, partial [Bacillota bacterium]
MYRFRVSKRIVTVFLLFLCLFFILCGRLVYLQVWSYPHLLEKGEDLWLRDLTLEAPRGEIIDRYGRVIVTNKRVKTLFIVPRQITDEAAVIEALSQDLELDARVVEEAVNQQVAVVKMREAIKLPPHVSTKLIGLELDGLYFVDDYERSYPYRSLLSHVLGFTGIDQQSLLGIEHMYDDVLSGEAGRIRYYADTKGRR